LNRDDGFIEWHSCGNISSKKRSSGFRPVRPRENRENAGSGGMLREGLDDGKQS